MVDQRARLLPELSGRSTPGKAFLLLPIVLVVQECKRCGAEAYPFEAQYKTVGTQNQGDPTKRHMAELCERCTSGLTCSAAEDHAQVAAEEVRRTAPTQRTRPAAMPRAPVTNPWQVPRPAQSAPPPACSYAVPSAARDTFARTTNDRIPEPADDSYAPPQSTSSSARTWDRADHHSPQQPRTASDAKVGSFCILF
jgi:hypothetical protein